MRKLNLKKENVAELTVEELGEVVGADAVTKQTQCYCSDFASCVPTDDCPTRDCVASLRSC